MAKVKAKIEHVPDVPDVVKTTDMVRVRFIGKDRAVLAGHIILHGEQRSVPRSAYAQAETRRPGEWELI